MFLLSFLAALAAAVPAPQCPDGSPPPCARPAPLRPTATDANRIAVLPFRVTAADTLLGSGLAELVAAEFASETGPRAVHMGSAIQAWRRAGGSSSTPLAQPQALRAARELGAGLLIDGSIVGLGSRLTVTASVMSVPDGRVRRAPQVSASADSIDVLLRRVVTSLLGVLGGELRAADRPRMTESPDALRAYMEALSAWRRADLRAATQSVELAIGHDSTFAQAVFLRYRIANWQVSNTQRWAAATFALRDRLSADDRILLVAFIGENFPAARHPSQTIRDRELAAQQLPDSPEALYALGDYLYHFAGAVDAPNRVARARALFERSYTLDSQATVLTHLVELAAMTADTASARRLRPAIEALGAAGTWAASWALAARTGDDAWLSALHRVPPSVRNVADGMFRAAVWGVGPEHTDQLRSRLPAEASVTERAGADISHAVAAAFQGRRTLSARIFTALGSNLAANSYAVWLGLFGDGDSAAAAAASERLIPPAGADSNTVAALQCTRAIWHLHHDQPETADSAFLARRGQANCAFMIGLLRSRAARSQDYGRRLVFADSLLRTRLNPPNAYAGWENMVLYRLWLEQGDSARALSAIRVRHHGFGLMLGEVVADREEGRLAAMLGDTARAIQAYRRYLDRRRDAEPALIPQRDSVRAHLRRIGG